MLPYFPPAYPDELLYSLLARFHRHVGETSPKRTLDVLFGNRSVRAEVLLQGHLLALSEELPPHRGLTPERLLADFTLYPYLTAFQPENVRRAARNDERVSPAHGRKMTAALLATGSPGPHLLMEQEGVGHGGPATVTDGADAHTALLRFAAWATGLEWPASES